MPPANDNFADATVLSGASGSVTFSNVDATSDFGSRASGHTVWFAWTPTVSGGVIFSTHDTPEPLWDSTLTAYNGQNSRTGDPLGYVYLIARDDDHDPQPGESYGTSKIRFYADAGITYYICVDAWDYPPPAERDDLVLTWTSDPTLLATGWTVPPVTTSDVFNAGGSASSTDSPDFGGAAGGAPGSGAGVRTDGGMTQLNLSFSWSSGSTGGPLTDALQPVFDDTLEPPTTVSVDYDSYVNWQQPTSAAVNVHPPIGWVDHVTLYFVLALTSGTSAMGDAVAVSAPGSPPVDFPWPWRPSGAVEATQSLASEWVVPLGLDVINQSSDDVYWSFVTVQPTAGGDANTVLTPYGTSDVVRGRVTYQPPAYRFLYEPAAPSGLLEVWAHVEGSVAPGSEIWG